MKTRFAAAGFALLFAIVLSAQNPGPSASAQTQAPSELTIEAIYAEGGLLGRPPESVKWAPDGSRVAFVQRDDSGEKGALYYVDANNPKPAVLVASEKLGSLAPPISNIKDERQKEAAQRYSVAAYHWSPDSKKLLFDSLGQLWLYSLDTGTGVQVTSSNDASVDPKFSPDGSRIAYVRKHNLYVRDISGGHEDALTRDDDPTLLNGEVDWVYEEELNVRSNYFWSPDGKQIVFLQMNEKPVPDYPITDWIPVHSTVDEQKYPQPGDANPVVRLGVVGTGGGKVKWLSAGGGSGGGVELGGDSNVYVPRFGWVRPGILWAMALNRAQDRLDLYFIDAKSGKSQLMMSESSDTWIDMGHSETAFLLLAVRRSLSLDELARRLLPPLPVSVRQSESAVRPGKAGAAVDPWRLGRRRALMASTKRTASFTSPPTRATGGRRMFMPSASTARTSIACRSRTARTMATFDPANAKYYVDTYSSLTTPPSHVVLHRERRVQRLLEAARHRAVQPAHAEEG